MRKSTINQNKKITKQEVKNFFKKLTAALFVILTLAITYLPGLPSWDDIYAAVGLREKTIQSQALKDLTVTFIDVGQGDSILIYTESTSILIDTGPSGNAKTIKDILDQFNIEALDYLIITHQHDDHMGSLTELEKLIEIENEIIPTETSKMAGLTLTLDVDEDSQMTIEFLAPIYVSSDLNNMSLVLKVTFGDISFLLMGDAEQEEEMSIIRTYDSEKLTANVLKVGHHGSESSSSIEFLKTVNPQYAVISVGKDNDYGHPHAQTLENLNSIGVEIHRTDEEGSIYFTTDGKNINFHKLE